MRALTLPLVGALLVLLVTGGTLTRMGSSDPYLSLLMSQAILQEGTIRLDAYRTRAAPPLDSYGTAGDVLVWGDHLYYYFPPGASLFLVPVVATANLMGLDMARAQDNLSLQQRVAPLFSVAAFLLLYGIGGLFVSRRAAWGIALLTVLGSALSSTVATALWNIGWVVLFGGIVLWLLARWEQGRDPSPHPLVIGGLLWACFITRPSTSAFIAVVLLFLLHRDRVAFLKASGIALGLLGLWVLFNLAEFGAWLPPYYNAAGRIGVHSRRVAPWVALYGHTFSPSRGLFVFSPMLLPVLAGALLYGRRLARQPLFWLCVGWLILHLGVASNTTRWWGGHAFGPRLLAETIPAWGLLTILVWREAAPHRARPLLRASYLSLAVVAVVINSVQGLYNLHTLWWNGTVPPNIDRHPAYLFDWRYPQFAATPGSLCARERGFFASLQTDFDVPLAPSRPATGLRFDAPFERVWFVGWSAPETAWRWSRCAEASVHFQPERVLASQYRVTLVASGLGRQRVAGTLNGAPLGEVVIDTPIGDAVIVTFPERAPLLPGAPNRLTLTLPDSGPPLTMVLATGEQRHLGIALRAIRVEAVAQAKGKQGAEPGPVDPAGNSPKVTRQLKESGAEKSWSEPASKDGRPTSEAEWAARRAEWEAQHKAQAASGTSGNGRGGFGTAPPTTTTTGTTSSVSAPAVVDAPTSGGSGGGSGGFAATEPPETGGATFSGTTGAASGGGSGGFGGEESATEGASKLGSAASKTPAKSTSTYGKSSSTVAK